MAEPRTLNELSSASLPLNDANLLHVSQSGSDRKVAFSAVSSQIAAPAMSAASNAQNAANTANATANAALSLANAAFAGGNSSRPFYAMNAPRSFPFVFPTPESGTKMELIHREYSFYGMGAWAGEGSWLRLSAPMFLQASVPPTLWATVFQPPASEMQIYIYKNEEDANNETNEIAVILGANHGVPGVFPFVDAMDNKVVMGWLYTPVGFVAPSAKYVASLDPIDRADSGFIGFFDDPANPTATQRRIRIEADVKVGGTWETSGDGTFRVLLSDNTSIGMPQSHAFDFPVKQTSVLEGMARIILTIDAIEDGFSAAGRITCTIDRGDKDLSQIDEVVPQTAEMTMGIPEGMDSDGQTVYGTWSLSIVPTGTTVDNPALELHSIRAYLEAEPSQL